MPIREASPKQFEITWYDAGREPRVAPNPLYPDGVDVDLMGPFETGCKVSVPYPAKRIGSYRLWCKLCNVHVAVTTAGRSDDPRSITIPCKDHA